MAVILILALTIDREPRYAGDPLSQWVLRLGAANGRIPPTVLFTPAGLVATSSIQALTINDMVRMLEKDTSYTEAELAIQRMGPQAVPFLIKWTNYRERPWRLRLAVLCSKLPPKLAMPASRFVIGHGSLRQQGAYDALAILGPQAKAAIPTLRRQVTSQQLGGYLPLMVLASIGQDGLPAILEVLRAPSNPNRIYAIHVLSQMDLGPLLNENVTATLITCLDDPNQTIALRAGGILCSHKSDQEAVIRIFTAAIQANDRHIRQDAAMPIRVCLMQGFSVATLLDLLRDTNSPYSPDAAAVLGNMLSNDIQLPDTVRPALICGLRDPRPSVRKHAAIAIGNLREDAEPAVSSLLDLWHDPDPAVRENATNALYQIPAYTVLKDVALVDNITTEPARTKWIQRYMTDSPAPQLTQLFQHPDPRIRQMATNAVQKLRDNSSQNSHSTKL
jgi:hypothetical protein